jgi:hypothetical protein
LENFIHKDRPINVVCIHHTRAFSEANEKNEAAARAQIAVSTYVMTAVRVPESGKDVRVWIAEQR